MNKYTVLLATALICGAGFSTSYAQPVLRDTVKDTNGHHVKNTWNNCVRTNFVTDTDACAPQEVVENVVVENLSDRSFQVFFDWDKYNLTTDAQNILNDLYSYAKSEPNVTYSVTGHTDTSGPVAYNIKLSEKRAVAVRNYLESLGATPQNVTVNWVGEAELLVPTADGVREAQNRRAQVVVNFQDN